MLVKMLPRSFTFRLNWIEAELKLNWHWIWIVKLDYEWIDQSTDRQQMMSWMRNGSTQNKIIMAIG